MTTQPGLQEVAKFRDLVADRLGLHIDESRLSNLADVLRNRVAFSGGGCSAYLDRFATGSFPNEDFQALARDLTVTETFFFRGKDQIAAFAGIVLHERMAALAGVRNVRILSAGCASGEEPYSLAIAVRENLPNSAEQVAITAFDINSVMLEKASHARYSNWSLREVSEKMKTRWFNGDGDTFSISPVIRGAVEFHLRNLAEDDMRFWQPEQFDVVFCRNVLMYFETAQAQAAVRRITRALVPGGYLFLGHAETLRGLSNEFHLCHTNDTFYYQRKTDRSADEEPSPLSPRVVEHLESTVAGDTSWVELIGSSTKRIHELVPGLGPANAASEPIVAQPALDLSHVLEHLHNERFDQALEQLGTLPWEHARDPRVLLLKAVSLCHCAALDEAQVVCREVLAREALNAGAHYVLALCREGVGDMQGAVEHDQEAAYLDGGFAMPRVHLGLLAKRRGDFDAAERELRQAISLLQSEDPARLLLFGGGFRREALVALCRAECVACAIHS